jgi:hypothetical protein
MANAEWVGLKELQAAIKRNPSKALSEGRNFLVRGLAVYKQGIIRNPWRIGGVGGGAPVRTGNLRDTHITNIVGLAGYIRPNVQAAPYAKYVHHGTRNMQGRPYLDYVKDTKSGQITSLYKAMLKNIVGDLAR